MTASRKPDVALVGDAAPQLRALIAALPRHNRPRHSRAQELKGHRAWFAERLSRLEPQMSFLKAIRAALPEDGIFVDEVSQIGFASRVALPIEKPRTFLSPGYQDNLGWGFGTALGAKAAMPDRKVLAIAGDGGFLYQMGELATAARHNLAVVVVVFDNGAFGNVKRIQQERYGNRLIASDLQNPDFGRLADSFGIASFKAIDARQLEDALHKAFALERPGPRLGPARRRAEPVGHDHDAEGPGIIVVLSAATDLIAACHAVRSVASLSDDSYG